MPYQIMLSAKILNMCYHHLMDFEKERMEVAATMARLYERTLTTATGGNVSARVGDVMLITPSGKDKASLKAEDIAVVDIATGCQIGTSWRLSIESEMHRSIYLKTDAKAVVHSHPTFASLYSALDETIDTHIIAETYYLLDEVVKVPYELMGTRELAEKVSTYACKAHALLLENHGALTTGATLLSAFDRMEVLEQAARLTYLSKSFGKLNDINGDRLTAIAAMR